MYLPGSSGQQVRFPLFDASGLIATGGTPQLLLPEAKSRSFLYIQNLDATHDLYVEFGGARATATISAGKLTGFTITNAGFGYTLPPIVELLGGGNGGNNTFLGVGGPGYPAPGDASQAAARFVDMSSQSPAKAHALLTTGAVTSFEIESAGGGYVAAPMVFMRNNTRDPFGAAIPSATSGVWLPAGGSNLYMNGTICPTDAVAIFGATTNTRYICKYAV